MNKTKQRILGRAIALVLVFVLAFSLAACDFGGKKSTVPGKPKELAAAVQTGGIKLTWTAADNGGETVSKYQITYALSSSDAADEWQTTSSLTSHTVTGLTAGAEYTFKVRAVNSVGAGEAAEVTETFGTVDNSPKVLNAVTKRIITDAVDLLGAAQNLAVDIERTVAYTGSAPVVTEMGVEMTTEDGFRARNGSNYYLLGGDGLWYEISTAEDATGALGAFDTVAAAKTDFTAAAENVYGLFGLVSVLNNAMYTLVVDGTTSTFTIYYSQNITNPDESVHKYSYTYTLVIDGGEISSLLREIVITNNSGGAEIAVETITAEYDYTITTITAPEDWEDAIYGDDGAATTIAQLSFAISKAIDEADTWDSDDDKLFELSIYAVYAKYFKYDANGKFVFDQTKLDNETALKDMIDAYIVATFYGLGVNLYADNLVEQISGSGMLDLSAFESFLKDMPAETLRGYIISMVKGEPTLISSFLPSNITDNFDFYVEQLFGGELDEARQKSLLSAELTDSYISVHFGRITRYATKGGTNVVTPEYGGIVEPTDRLTTTQRNALSSAITVFENTTEWQVTMSSVINIEGIGDMPTFAQAYARRGEGQSFSSLTANISDAEYRYIAKSSEGIFYEIAYDGTPSSSTYVEHTIFTNAAEAEAAFKAESDEEILSPLRLENEEGFVTTFESFAENNGTFTFTLKGKMDDIEMSGTTYSVQVTREIRVFDGKITVAAILMEILDSTKTLFMTQTVGFNFTYEATSITPPVGWEEDVAGEDEPPTVAHLIAALNHATSNPTAWDSNADTLFALKNYAEFAQYFVYDESDERFEFDSDTLDDPTAFEEMWNAYLVDYVYKNLGGVDLYSTGLHTKLFAALTAAGLPFSLLITSLTPGDTPAADAANRATVIGALNTMVFATTTDPQKKVLIAGAVGQSYIVIEDGRVIAFSKTGEVVRTIIYND